ncbi:MAG TPA: hypothetical protein ENK18_00855, partial [Deltaproteobacteria bacterium]|nr:hypothetical protein [Deltaproteobacteria bacterium]
MTDEVGGEDPDSKQWAAFRSCVARLGADAIRIASPQMLLGNTSAIGPSGAIGHVFTTNPGPWVELWR